MGRQGAGVSSAAACLGEGKLPSMQPLKTLPAFFNADDIEVQTLGSSSANSRMGLAIMV